MGDFRCDDVLDCYLEVYSPDGVRACEGIGFGRCWLIHRLSSVFVVSEYLYSGAACSR